MSEKLNIEAAYRRWRKPIRTWLNNQRVPVVWIEDLSQEVFVRLLRYNREGLEVNNTAGYVFRIVSNIAAEWRKRCAIKCPHEAEWLDDLLVDADKQPEAVQEHGDLIAMVQAALSTLPKRQQLMINLHVNQEMTNKQIAVELGVTYRTVLRDLSRAYSSLRKLLHNTDLIDIVLVDAVEVKKLLNTCVGNAGQ